MELKTKRLSIREYVPSDLIALTELRSEPKYVEMTPWDDHSKEYSKKLNDDFIRWQSESPRNKYHFAICHSDDQLLIGTTGIHIKSFTHREAELALFLSINLWGKGYAEEVGQVMIDYAFNELNLHRLAAETLSKNKRAVNFCYKIGMKYEGKFRQNKFYNNKWYDSVRFSILNDEWDND